MKAAPLEIRKATTADHDAIWRIFHQVVIAGDTFSFDPKISRSEALAFWCGAGTHTYVAEQNGFVHGSYYLRANHQGGGAHVANAGYMVAPESRGHHIGRQLAEHSLPEAYRLGFRALQFNFVVSTNVSAVHLWKDLGFKIVGTLPAAFRHPQKGFVDVYVMFRSLVES